VQPLRPARHTIIRVLVMGIPATVLDLDPGAPIASVLPTDSRPASREGGFFFCPGAGESLNWRSAPDREPSYDQPWRGRAAFHSGGSWFPGAPKKHSHFLYGLFPTVVGSVHFHFVLDTSFWFPYSLLQYPSTHTLFVVRVPQVSDHSAPGVTPFSRRVSSSSFSRLDNQCEKYARLESQAWQLQCDLYPVRWNVRRYSGQRG